MSRYLAILGRQPEISIAELESVLSWAGPADCCPPPKMQAIFGGPPPQSLPAHVMLFELPSNNCPPDINRLGGVLKLAEELPDKPLDYLQSLPDGKITIGVSDYSKNASRKTAAMEALKLKKMLVPILSLRWNLYVR